MASLTETAISLLAKVKVLEEGVSVLCAAMLCAAVYFKARGETSTEFEGTWEMGFEQSDFFIGGNCARPRYWLHASEDVYSKVSTLGDPRAVRIKFVGTSTRMGDYGHLGQYLREVHVEKVLSIEPTQPCLHH